MKHVFIAIGGSGTKVAEALVRLLAAGAPTRRDENGYLTSVGDSLQIWRVDPDRTSGAASALNRALEEYRTLQHVLQEQHQAEIASSHWAIDVESNVRHLDPLQLREGSNGILSLRGILDASSDKKKAAPLLAAFYAEKDLDVELDRGFYQKPFIGSAVMSVFANSLEDDSSPAGRKAGLTAFDSTPVNFFLCGSLHGGTGACGVPVMGRFLSARRKMKSWPWRVGGCLLAPYCVPPQPPFGALPEGEPIDTTKVRDLAKRYANEPAFFGMTPEEKEKLVTQILLGFYANPEDIEARARQGLTFYKDHSADYFDELYLVGKPAPDKLTRWSNGGGSQENPSNSAEFVAALSALNFFANAGGGNKNSYLIGSSNSALNPERLRIGQLPTYRVGPTEVDPEKLYLTGGLLCHLLQHQIPWSKDAQTWPKEFESLRAVYLKDTMRQNLDWENFKHAAQLLSQALIAPIHPQQTIGWHADDIQDLWGLLSNEPQAIQSVQARLAKKGFFSKEAAGVNTLGHSSIKITTFDFGQWCPPRDKFTRGRYLRHVWNELYNRCQSLAARQGVA